MRKGSRCFVCGAAGAEQRSVGDPNGGIQRFRLCDPCGERAGAVAEPDSHAQDFQRRVLEHPVYGPPVAAGDFPALVVRMLGEERARRVYDGDGEAVVR